MSEGGEGSVSDTNSFQLISFCKRRPKSVAYFLAVGKIVCTFCSFTRSSLFPTYLLISPIIFNVFCSHANAPQDYNKELFIPTTTKTTTKTTATTTKCCQLIIKSN